MLYHSARISEITWSKLENVRDSTTQTVAWVTLQKRGHRFPAGLSAHPLQPAVTRQSIQPAVAIYALWRSEGNEGFDLCRDSPQREGGGLNSGDLLFRVAAEHTVCDSVVSNAIQLKSVRLRRNCTATGRAGGAAELQWLGAPLAWIFDDGAELNPARNALCIRLNYTGARSLAIKRL